MADTRKAPRPLLGLAGRELMIGRHLGATTLGKSLIGRNVDLDVGLRGPDAFNRDAQREATQAEEHVRDKRQQQKGNELGKLLMTACDLDVVGRGAQKCAQRRGQARHSLPPSHDGQCGKRVASGKGNKR